MLSLKNQLELSNWHCEPPNWRFENGALVMSTGDKTDFWQHTYYGFRRDDGHFLGIPVEGDFAAELTFEGEYHTLYDQAGVMLRTDEMNWVKAGVEYSDGATNLSVVITRDGCSDWSAMRLPMLSGPQTVRLARVDDSVIVHFLSESSKWSLLRLGRFGQADKGLIGPMACSPKRHGFNASFIELEIGAVTGDPLHI